MHRVVLKTPDGVAVSTFDVRPDALESFLSQLATRTDLCAYIEESPAELMAPMYVDPAASPVTFQDVKSLSETLTAVVSDIHRGYGAVLEAEARSFQRIQEAEVRHFQRLQDFWHETSERHLDMQRDLADEAVRQRRLTAQSLGDIDLMHRAVKAAELNESFAERKAKLGLVPAGAPQAVAREPTNLQDFARAIKRIVGDNQ